jgi:predicted site-specific integrase-resolvase
MDHQPPSQTEKLLTLTEAADCVGAKYWQLQRAVKRGLIPSFAPFNSRRLLRLSDVIALIEASRQGGQ